MALAIWDLMSPGPLATADPRALTVVPMLRLPCGWGSRRGYNASWEGAGEVPLGGGGGGGGGPLGEAPWGGGGGGGGIGGGTMGGAIGGGTNLPCTQSN